MSYGDAGTLSAESVGLQADSVNNDNNQIIFIALIGRDSSQLIILGKIVTVFISSP